MTTKEPLRVRVLDFDARREPRTDLFCCCCQHDIRSGRQRYTVLLTTNMGVLHPEDAPRLAERSSRFAALWDENHVTTIEEISETKLKPIGVDCAK